MAYAKDIEVKQWLRELESSIPEDRAPFYRALRYNLGLSKNKFVQKQTRDKAKAYVGLLRDFLYFGKGNLSISECNEVQEA
jgi:hypothetical protein